MLNVLVLTAFYTIVLLKKKNKFNCKTDCGKVSSINIPSKNNSETENYSSCEEEDDLDVPSNSAKLDELLRGNKAIQSILRNYIKLEERVATLENEIVTLKQEKLDDHVVFGGIPNVTVPSDEEIILEVTKTLGSPVTKNDILEIRRIKQKNHQNDGNKEYSSIIVQFLSPAFKTKLMRAKKRHGPLFTHQFTNDDDSERQVFLSSFLTSFNLDLLKYAKKLKSNGFKYVWFDNFSNQVLAKTNSESNSTVIKSKTQVDQIIRNK